MAIEKKLRAKIGVMVFLSKMVNANFNTPRMLNYKGLLNKVSRKIDVWHEQIGKEKFQNDNDFVEDECSPSKFETSSEDEEPQTTQTGDSTKAVTRMVELPDERPIAQDFR